MTDNEIKKALESCIAPKCGECPIFNNSEIRKVPGRCVHTLEKEAFDLINRQKAEIERLQGDNEKLKKANTFLAIEIFHTKIAAVKEFAAGLKDEYKDFDETHNQIFYSSLCSAIDNLVKEMVGENL